MLNGHQKKECRYLKYDVILSKTSPRKEWGFKWNMAALAKGQMEVNDVQRDSPCDLWNREQLRLERRDRMVRRGDRLISVEGKSTRNEMQKLLKEDMGLTMIFQQTAASEEIIEPPEARELQSQRVGLVPILCAILFRPSRFGGPC